MRISTAAMLVSYAMIVASGTCSANPFTENGTVTVVTSMAGGGTYDIGARIIARHMPKHLPSTPRMIVQNMPGAGNVLATNYMYNVAPKDGSSIAVVNNAIPLHQVIDGTGVRYDVRKFNWLGSPVRTPEALIVLTSAGVKSFEDLRTTEIIAGGIGAASSNVVWPKALNRVLGTKIKIVAGYKGGPDLWIAIEKGEIQARTGNYTDIISQRPDWISGNKITVPIQIGSTKHRMLPDVPTVADLKISDEQRRVLDLIFSPTDLGQPYLAPPGVSEDVMKTLRTAFAATMQDEAVKQEMLKAKIEIDPISASELKQHIDRLFSASPEIIEAAKKATATD